MTWTVAGIIMSLAVMDADCIAYAMARSMGLHRPWWWWIPGSGMAMLWRSWKS